MHVLITLDGKEMCAARYQYFQALISSSARTQGQDIIVLSRVGETRFDGPNCPLEHHGVQYGHSRVADNKGIVSLYKV